MRTKNVSIIIFCLLFDRSAYGYCSKCHFEESQKRSRNRVAGTKGREVSSLNIFKNSDEVKINIYI